MTACIESVRTRLQDAYHHLKQSKPSSINNTLMVSAIGSCLVSFDYKIDAYLSCQSDDLERLSPIQIAHRMNELDAR